MLFRFLLLIFLFASQAFAEKLPPMDLSTPRGTFKTFLKSMVLVKKGIKTEEAYQRATKTLDTTHFDPATRKVSAKRVANQLVNTLDRLEKVDYADIPQKVQGDLWTYAPKKNIQIHLQKNKQGHWLFTQQTVNHIDQIFNQVKNDVIVEDIIILKDFTHFLKANTPKWMGENFLFLKWGQWFGIFFLLLASYLIKKIINFFYIRFILHSLKIVHVPKEKVVKLAEPLGVIGGITFIIFLLPILQFKDMTLAFWVRALYIALSFLFIWLGFTLVDLVALVLRKWAQKTKTKADDILVPLVAKTLKGLVIVLGIIFIAQSLKIDVTNMLAGLGIGAMAFAFAAKDTLANFFGSLMIVLDRPFDIGDYVKVDGQEGTIEEVGFRSTRIRSFQDSIISIPNGQLANLNINNFGRRRFRRTDITLGLEYDTKPELIENFIQKIKEIILTKEWLKNDQFLVYFDQFADSSLNIQVRVYIITQDFAQECDYKHQFLLDLLKLGNQMGVQFAFPTQTIHLKK